jgi:hypothetical protein
MAGMTPSCNSLRLLPEVVAKPHTAAAAVLAT